MRGREREIWCLGLNECEAKGGLYYTEDIYGYSSRACLVGCSFVFVFFYGVSSAATYLCGVISLILISSDTVYL